MLQFITILLAAIISLWLALFTGIALGISPVPLVIALTAGYTLSAAIVLWGGKPVRDRLLRYFDCSRYSRLQKFGVVTVALMAPVVTGAHIGAALGLAFNVSSRRLLVFMTAGAALWSVTLLVATSFGISLFV